MDHVLRVVLARKVVPRETYRVYVQPESGRLYTDPKPIRFLASGQRFLDRVAAWTAWARRIQYAFFVSKESLDAQQVGIGRWVFVDDDGASDAPYPWPGQIPPPSMIIETSPGRKHLYWELSEPAPATEVTAASQYISRVIGGDTCSDLERMTRVPGSWNCKLTPPIRSVVRRFAPRTIPVSDLLPASPLPSANAQRSAWSASASISRPPCRTIRG
jgi:hypothetical protein